MKGNSNCKHWKEWQENGERFGDCMADCMRGCLCPKNCPARERIVDWRVVDRFGMPTDEVYNTERQADIAAKKMGPGHESLPFVANRNTPLEY